MRLVAPVIDSAGNLLMMFAPLEGWRRVKVADRLLQVLSHPSNGWSPIIARR
jgi:hypothetical protein